MSRHYFNIDLQMLGVKEEEEALFPFHIHIFNPSSESYSTFLFANSPLTKEKRGFLDFILQRGGEIAIKGQQKLTFLKHTNLKEEDIPSLKIPETHDLISKREKLLKDKEALESGQKKFHMKEQFNNATKNDNFLPMIDQCRREAMVFSPAISHTVSLASYLTEHLLTEDNFINRVVALSYHLAKGCGMEEDLALGDLICAAFFSHLGQTQMNLFYSHMPQLEQNDQTRKEWRKHPGLSQHLIRKSGVILSERCHKIITDHHERWNGSGYPDQKAGQFLEPLSLILGASAHLLEYYSGKVTGTKVPMITIIMNLKNKSLTPGLELDFGDTIYDGLIYMLDDKKNDNEDHEGHTNPLEIDKINNEKRAA